MPSCGSALAALRTGTRSFAKRRERSFRRWLPPRPLDGVVSKRPAYQGATLTLVALGLCLAATACASQAALNDRTFFRNEYEVDTHGRKTWFDHLVETDPGGIKAHVAPEYESIAPARIAVLPFVDSGSAQFVVDKRPLTARSPEQQADWAWTHSNRLRRAVDGYLSSREFLVENLIQVDQIMKEHRIYDATSLGRMSPQVLGQLLGVDAVVYGEVTQYEAYYLALVSAYQIGVRIRMVSTHDGSELFTAEGSRYDVDVAPAFDPVDVAINSAFTLLQLRDIVLARAEDESAREIILRIPRSQRLQDELIEEATDAPSQSQQEDVATLPQGRWSPAAFRRRARIDDTPHRLNSILLRGAGRQSFPPATFELGHRGEAVPSLRCWRPSLEHCGS